MALKWFLNSALTQVFGHTDNISLHHTNVIACRGDQGQVQECVKSLKDSKEGITRIETRKEDYPNGFQMPLHYPRYSKADYEKMEEWKLDMLLNEYGFCFKGTLDEKRAFAMGAFLWPNQL